MDRMSGSLELGKGRADKVDGQFIDPIDCPAKDAACSHVLAGIKRRIQHQAIAPFGGMGASGNGGRFGSLANWEEFTQWQWVTARPQAHGFPF